MANFNNHSKSAASGPKTRTTVGLGSELSLCKEAQMLIDVLGNHINDFTLDYVKECFEGFTGRVQRMIAEALMNALIGRLFGGGEVMLCGILNVDDIVLKLVNTLDEEIENLDPHEH